MLPALLVALALAAPAPNLEIKPIHTFIGNLTYQLDVMAGLTPGSAPAFKLLWKDKLQWTEQDDTALQAWAEFWRKRQGRDQTMRLPRAAPLPLGVSSPDLYQQTRQALMNAQVLDGVDAALKGILAPMDVTQVKDALGKFANRLKPWYEMTAKPPLDKAASALMKGIVDFQLTSLFSQAAELYGANLSNGTAIQLNLLARPPGGGFGSSAQQIGSHSLVEVQLAENPLRRLDVVTHEAFHYLYHSAPANRHLALAEWFCDPSRSGGIAAFNLFNEAMATALGNGVVAKRVEPNRYEQTRSRPLGFYADDAIDRMAKAILPDVEEALKVGLPFDSPVFLTKYLAAFNRTFSYEAEAPRLILRTLFIAADDLFAQTARDFARSARAAFTSMATPANRPGIMQALEGFQSASGVILVKKEKVNGLRAWERVLGTEALSDIKRRASEAGGFMVIGKRRQGSFLFVLVSDNPGEVETALKWLLRQKQVETGIRDLGSLAVQ